LTLPRALVLTALAGTAVTGESAPVILG
jgi:hypothetical protein